MKGLLNSAPLFNSVQPTAGQKSTTGLLSPSLTRPFVGSPDELFRTWIQSEVSLSATCRCRCTSGDVPVSDTASVVSRNSRGHTEEDVRICTVEDVMAASDRTVFSALPDVLGESTNRFCAC
ncbi:hypothetical protein J6590_027113 [Homalodisca vitripennis]|nr:hypothetical protein J6590_027113 [Homalodisca vitripennis]